MKTFKTLAIFLILTLIWSCNNTNSNKKLEKASNNDSTISVNKRDSIIENVLSEKNEVWEDTTADIKFKDISISINRLILFDDDKQLNQIQKDTVYLYADLGETIEGQKITIVSSQLTNITIEQRYETSVTIMDDGPHCDLTEWKHYDSAWEKLKTNDKGQFIGDSYSEKDLEKFPVVDISELKAYVKKHCDEEYSELISTIKSPTEYPSAVSVSRYFLRINGKRKNSDETVTKLIIIEVAMGC
jgi:hypothetical protein